jgi:hypothetical protein
VSLSLIFTCLKVCKFVTVLFILLPLTNVLFLNADVHVLSFRYYVCLLLLNF